MALIEVFGTEAHGFWLVHKGAKYLEQIYDMLSMKAKSWSEQREIYKLKHRHSSYWY